MSYRTFLEIHNDLSHTRTFDRRLLRDVKNIRLEFVNRNDVHVNFFATALMGVYPVRWAPRDTQRWFDEIVGANDFEIREAVTRLPHVDKTWKRVTDPTNSSMLWAAHRFYTSPSLSSKERYDGAYQCLLLLQYKFITSLMAHFYPHPTDPEIALAAYEALSRKFSLRRAGSWQTLLEERATFLLTEESSHHEVFKSMDSGKGDVIAAISEIQKGLRDVVKRANQVFYDVRDGQLRIRSSSSVMQGEGGIMEAADSLRDQTGYLRYLHQIIADKETFIRQELVDATVGVLSSTNPRYLLEALTYCSDNYGLRGDKRIGELLDETIVHVFSYLSETKGTGTTRSDLSELITKLRNLYMAPRMSDPALIRIKELSEKITRTAISSRNRPTLASTRTALTIYLVLRTFAKNHYS